MDKNLLQKVYDPEAFRKAGHALVDLLADHLQHVQKRPDEAVIRWEEPQDALQYWTDYQADPQHPEQLFRDILDKSIHLHHPRYMGHQISVAAPMAALTSLLDGLLNNGMGVYEMGQAGTAIEKVVVNILNQSIGYPEAADGVLTSGGTLANLTALLCARQHQSQLDPWKEGSREQFCLLVSEEAHYCVDRAVRIMGWGEEGIVKVPVDENFRMRTDLLEKYHREAVAKGKTVVAVVGSAPSTATGTYDRLEEMAAFCQAHGLWFHVDGAHGGAAIFSARYRHLLKGLEQADSIVIDCHKMMMTPSVATALLFKNGAHSHATFSQKAQYLWSKAEGREWHNLARRTFECTKLMMSLRFYALYKLHGAAAFDAFVSKLYDAGRQFARLLAAQEDFECLLPEPDANIVCFRYVPSDLAAEQWDALNAQIRQHLIEQGRFYIVETKIRGRHYLRTTIMNPMTDVQDFEELLSCVRLAAVAGPEIPQ